MNYSIVPKELSRDPFRTLFLEFLESFDVSNIPAKTQALQNFARELDELESSAENESTFLHWGGIFSVFSSAGVLSGLTVLNPILGIIASGAAAASAIGVVSLAFAQNQERKPILEKLRRYRIALNSDQAINWAALWQYAGTDILLGSLYAASAGYLSDNRTLIRNDGKNPMAAALDSCCQYYGVSREELICQLQQLKQGVKVLVPIVPKEIAQSATVLQSAPTVLQTAPPATNEWMKGFLSSTCLAWGNQGSGKSWFVRYLVKEKIEAGYKVVVFDPNSNKSEWRGVELFNNYADIEQKMREYVDEVMGRYAEFGASEISESEWRSQLWANGKAISFVCEEATTYADFIADKELLTKFVKVATTLSRKQEMPVVFVAHNNTQSCLGNIKGLANLINRMQQIQLLATTDPNTNQPVASGEALIKLDGSEEWVKVFTPKLTDKIRDFGEEVLSDKERLERLFAIEFSDRSTPVPESCEPSIEPSNQRELKDFSNLNQSSEERFTPLNLTKEQVQGMISALRTELNQTQIIEKLWQCKKGGSAAWREAYEQFKKLTENN